MKNCFTKWVALAALLFVSATNAETPPASSLVSILLSISPPVKVSLTGDVKHDIEQYMGKLDSEVQLVLRGAITYDDVDSKLYPKPLFMNCETIPIGIVLEWLSGANIIIFSSDTILVCGSGSSKAVIIEWFSVSSLLLAFNKKEKYENKEIEVVINEVVINILRSDPDFLNIDVSDVDKKRKDFVAWTYISNATARREVRGGIPKITTR